MPRRVPNKIIERLEAARKAATLENASFGFSKDSVVPHERFGEMNGKSVHPTDYIKAKVKSHHEAWIIREIDIALAWARGESQE